MKRRPHGHHQLESLGDGGERGRRRPGIERGRVDALDVVEQELGDQREVVADLLAALRQTPYVLPRRLHALVVDVPQPAAEDGEPVAISHTRASVLGTRYSDVWLEGAA